MVLEFLVIEPGASAVEPGEGPPSAGSKKLPYGPPGQTSLLGRDVPSSRRTLPTRDCRHRTRPQGREKPEFQAQSWKTSWRQHGSQCSPPRPGLLWGCARLHDCRPGRRPRRHNSLAPSFSDGVQDSLSLNFKGTAPPPTS